MITTVLAVGLVLAVCGAAALLYENNALETDIKHLETELANVHADYEYKFREFSKAFHSQKQEIEFIRAQVGMSAFRGNEVRH